MPTATTTGQPRSQKRILDCFTTSGKRRRLLRKRGRMLIGYARVSSAEQNLDLQRDALGAAGCKKIFTDKMSGARADRPGLTEILNFGREGDVLIVWRLDLLGRSLSHVIEIVRDLQQRGVGFRSLTETIDTTTSGGKLTFHVFGALAEFEKDPVRDGTLAGLHAARQRGRIGGRHRSMIKKKSKRRRSSLQTATHRRMSQASLG
jgi:DNA invertase Pin-like site-specific DNA recombinase